MNISAIRSSRKFLSSFMGFMLLSGSGLHAQEIMKPPFGLNWGDSPEKLVTWASAHSLDLTIKIPGGEPSLRVLSVSPRSGLLPDSTASALEGKFLNGGLFELTVHYHDSSASPAMMEERFKEMKKQITRDLGPLMANQQRRVVEDQFVTRTQAFHRESIKGVFLLIAWTEVEDLLRKTKQARFSLIYRNDNFKEELLKKVE